MVLCTELHLCRTKVLVGGRLPKARVQLRVRRTIALWASLRYPLSVFLQLTICSNQPKTALHTAALNGTQLIKLRTFIYYTCDEFFWEYGICLIEIFAEIFVFFIRDTNISREDLIESMQFLSQLIALVTST